MIWNSSPQLALVQWLIERRQQFDPATEKPGTIRIERGALLADAALGRTGSPSGTTDFDPGNLPVIDGCGHARSFYPGLLRYCLVLTARGRSAPSPQPEQFEDAGRSADRSSPARLGGAIAGRVWSALADWVAGRSLHSTEIIRHVIANRSPTGSFLTPSPSDNPETFWFHDLILLHAVDAFADLARDPEAARAAQAAAEYHQNSTQPDHATGEPWGLSAFLKSSATLETADALLHAVQTTQPDGPRGVTLLLLADTLYRARPRG